MFKIYKILYIKLYNLMLWSYNDDDVADIGAIVLLSVFASYNIISIIRILNKIASYSILNTIANSSLIHQLIGYFVIIIIHFLLLKPNKNLDIMIKEYDEWDNKYHDLGNILIWGYFILTIALFIMSLSK